jgi:anaerobic selenocysteine-containing dehydrogenase
MTNHWIDIRNSDVILIMGSNAAENHPILASPVPAPRLIFTPLCVPGLILPFSVA